MTLRKSPARWKSEHEYLGRVRRSAHEQMIDAEIAYAKKNLERMAGRPLTADEEAELRSHYEAEPRPAIGA